MGGQPNPVSQQTTSTPSLGAQALSKQAADWASAYGSGGGITLPGFSPIAQFTDPQRQGQQMALNAAGGQQGTADSATAAHRFLTSGAALDPSTNPGLASAIRFAQMPVEQQLTENTLPALRANATGVGQFGSSRDEIQEGLAARGAAQAEGKIASDMTNANYQNALDQMTRAMGLTPQVQTSQINPAATVSGVGDVQQALNQANLGYNWQSQIFPQENALSTAQALAGISSGLPGGTTGTTASGPTTQPWQYMLGGGSLLAGLGGPSGLGSMFSGLGSLFGGGPAVAAGSAANLGGAAATEAAGGASSDALIEAIMAGLLI